MVILPNDGLPLRYLIFIMTFFGKFVLRDPSTGAYKLKQTISSPYESESEGDGQMEKLISGFNFDNLAGSEYIDYDDESIFHFIDYFSDGTVAIRPDITEVEIINTPAPGDVPPIRVVRVVAGGQEYVYDWHTAGGSFIKTNFPNGKEPIN